MSDKKKTVNDKMVVSLEYVLCLSDGEEISRSEDNAPLEYIHGHNQIISGLEKSLYGMGVGDEKDVTVAPEEGYGEHLPNEIIKVDRENFPSSFELVEGKPVSVKDEETGKTFTAKILEVHPESVTLDFNHPLAGETLHFSVKVVGLRHATEEEMSHGHVHDGDHAH
ncbi:MAG: peptidylprolyl isomerase [Anaerolineales bacterium]|jgi:FKBP-type peptidyl-prolyl cis-trans isomerase SlyD